MKRESIVKLTYLALFVALIFMLQITRLGYLKFTAVEITLMGIPVILGAIVLGPIAGTILGAAFGVTSLMEAYVSPLFAPFLSTDLLALIIICFLPRILMGVLTGWLSKFLKKIIKFEDANFIITSLIGSLINTFLFIGSIFIFLYKPVMEKLAEFNLITATPEAFTAFWVGVGVTNGIPEAILCVIIVTATAKALSSYQRKKSK